MLSSALGTPPKKTQRRLSESPTSTASACSVGGKGETSFKNACVSLLHACPTRLFGGKTVAGRVSGPGKPSGDAVDRRLSKYKFEPMDLANMRQNGVRSLLVMCHGCRHEVILNVDQYPGDLLVPRVRSSHGLHQTAGFEEERQRKQTVLFPVRLDEAVMDTNEAWAAKLRARNDGDLRRWKDHDAYKRTFERVLRDLTKPQAQ
jgi:hypothetical protein